MAIQAAAQRVEDFDGELKSNYAGDPDAAIQGFGLQSFPLIHRALGAKDLLKWEMAPSEQVALLFLLEHLRPKVAIEIGTRYGGSLQVLAKLCGRVYSLDIDADIPSRLDGKFPNVEYLTGPSERTLPPLIERLQREQAELGFVLVDGDHTTEGVRKDIEALLKFQPGIPLYIVMHDSMNPRCRAGLRRADWAANPYVHAVELDFVSGSVNSSVAFRGQLWGGLALGICLPVERTHALEITARSELTYQAVMRMIARDQTVLKRAVGKMKSILTPAALRSSPARPS